MTGQHQYYTKVELGAAAQQLSTFGTLRSIHPDVFIPVDYETNEYQPTPPPERMAWQLVDRPFIYAYAQKMGRIFYGQDEKNFFDTLHQTSLPEQKPVGLLLRTDDGLKLLKDGVLVDPTGEFAPNLLPVKLNNDPVVKTELFKIISEWVDGDEDAVSLLRHVSVALQPGWTAVKRVLLIGNGRNGKGVFLKLLQSVIGEANCSYVTRKQMDTDTQAVLSFGEALVNIVFDAQAETIKDTSTEKTVLAGEEVAVRPNYARRNVMVSTNAMHIEGMNDEPSTWDKTFAMDARHVRFYFPNTYALDPIFGERMRSDELVGAFLSLLIDYMVQKEDVAVMLTPTAKSEDLALQQKLTNNIGIRFMVEAFSNGTTEEDLTKIGYKTLCDMFIAWRKQYGDAEKWDNFSARRVLKHVVVLDKNRRMFNDLHGNLVKQSPIIGLKPDVKKIIDAEVGDITQEILEESE